MLQFSHLSPLTIILIRILQKGLLTSTQTVYLTHAIVSTSTGNIKSKLYLFFLFFFLIILLAYLMLLKMTFLLLDTLVQGFL